MSQTKINSKTYELSTFADIAYNILNKDTDYIKSKKIISKIFNKNWGNRSDTVKFRLTIIDNFYSTQMNKRFFGIDDLADKLKNFTDEILVIKCKEYLDSENKDNEIGNLFEDTYGIHKLGKDGGRAGSLISKYLYFLTNYEFPIYDSLVKISYGYIRTKYAHLEIPKLESKCGNPYFESIVKLKDVSEIDTYNKLDNLLWLIGKLTNGSLSLILNKDRYKDLLKKLNISEWSKNKKPNELIRKRIRSNFKDLHFFKKNEIKFIKYSFDLAGIPIKIK